MANGLVGVEIAKALAKLNEEIVGLFIPSSKNQISTDETISILQVPRDKIFVANKSWTNDELAVLSNLQPDLILAIYWPYILPKNVFLIPRYGTINFHMAYLPYNRGKKPNVWPILDGTPAGISMHYIDEGVDTGPIIARTKIVVEPVDTAETLFYKQVKEFPKLFCDVWPRLKKNGALKGSVDPEVGTFHFDSEFQKLNEIDLTKSIMPIDLINLLRAKTFPPHPGAYFMHDGRKVYVRIQLEYSKEEE